MPAPIKMGKNCRKIVPYPLDPETERELEGFTIRALGVLYCIVAITQCSVFCIYPIARGHAAHISPIPHHVCCDTIP